MWASPKQSNIITSLHIQKENSKFLPFFLLKERRHLGIFKRYRHNVAESPFFNLLSLLLRYIKQQWKDTLIGLKLKLLIFILIYCCHKPDLFIWVCHAAMGIWEVLKSFCNTKIKTPSPSNLHFYQNMSAVECFPSGRKRLPHNQGRRCWVQSLWLTALY